MGKWIAALVILLVFVVPLPFFLVNHEPLSDLALSWITPKDEAALGKQYLADIATRNFTPVVKALDPSLVTPQVESQLEKVTRAFPNERPKSIKLVGSFTAKTSDATNYHFSYEYAFSKHWLLASITLRRAGGKLHITAFHVQPTAISLAEQNALTLVGKGQTHYLFAAAATALEVFWLVSVLTCLFTPIARRKWLWVLFVMVGVMGLNLNWTTGAVTFLLLNIGVPTVRLWSDAYSPWIVQLTLPLGALIFWSRRRALIEATAPPASDLRR